MSSVIIGLGLPVLRMLAERWINSRMAETGESRDEVIAGAQADWDEAEKDAIDLRKLGHENDTNVHEGNEARTDTGEPA